MRVRPSLLLSIGLNIALIAAWAYTHYRHAHTVSPKVTAKKPFNPFEFNTKTNVVVRRLNFTWQEVESQDYPTYVENLRTIGCPETTIRDIIVADVDQLYAHRRTAEVVTNDFQWWQSDPDTNELQRIDSKLKALEEERATLLTRLLGPDWNKPTDPVAPAVRTGVNLAGPVLGDLPAKTKDAVYAIAERAKINRDAYIKARVDAGTPADPVEMARMRQQVRSQLAEVLSPDQLEEFLLRYSETAEQMRREFRGLNLTPDEFRSIFRIRDPIEQETALLGTEQNVSAAARVRSLQTQVEGTLRQTLGADRYLNYKLNQDPLFRETKSRAEQIGATPEVMLSLYEINQATQAERARIQADATLSADDKIEALAAMQADQQKSLQRLLGPEAFARWMALQPTP